MSLSLEALESEESPDGFCISIESELGINYYAYNSSKAVEVKIDRIVSENLRWDKKTILLTANKALARHYFLDIFQTSTLRRHHQKLIEIRQDLTKNQDVSTIIYPCIETSSEAQIKQALRIAQSYKVYCFCSKKVHKVAKERASSLPRRLLLSAIESSGLNLIV